jgi:hypothetical protein
MQQFRFGIHRLNADEMGQALMNYFDAESRMSSETRTQLSEEYGKFHNF